jgi:hypothetical protein
LRLPGATTAQAEFCPGIATFGVIDRAFKDKQGEKNE